MAIIKHIAIKNSNYTSAVNYLTYQHDEFTKKPILDDQGRLIPREGYLIEGINCTQQSYGLECTLTNHKYGKNLTRGEIKAHHYIISFDPRDREENHLTPERAQELGMDFARKHFPGHQILVCTHPDGHNTAGNIHVHIVLNSVRALDVEPRDFMEHSRDSRAGFKHHVSDTFLTYLKQQTMSMCQQESLNQVDLLHPARIRITDREYWVARRMNQPSMDTSSTTNLSSAPEPKRASFDTQKAQLRKAITSALNDSSSYLEFQRKLMERYGIIVQESRGRIGYLLPDRSKPIRGRMLGTDFEKEHLMEVLRKSHNLEKGVSSVATPSILRRIVDVQSNEKAQRVHAYASKVMGSNLQKMEDTLEFVQKYGIQIDELPQLQSSTSADFEAKRRQLRTTETELKELSSLIRSTRSYYKTKAIHSEYLKARDKKAFRESHYSDLALYDAAIHDLKAHYGPEKFHSLKALLGKQKELLQLKNQQYEEFCFARSKRRELQVLESNLHLIHTAPALDQTIT